ncbi:ABC transporter, partial [Rhizobium sp. Pop5]
MHEADVSDAPDDDILRLEGIGKRFPGVVALKDVSMRIGRGKGHI